MGGLDVSPDSGNAATGDGLRYDIVSVREALHKLGMQDLPIVVTEVGWPSRKDHRMGAARSGRGLLGLGHGASVELQAMSSELQVSVGGTAGHVVGT